MAERLVVSGARGASATEIARRTGNWGVAPTDNDKQALDKFADAAIQQNPGFKGDTGPTGPANSTYTSLASLKAAPQSNRSYILADGTNSPVTYAYVAGDFTGRADEVNVVKLDAVPLTTGALVRQSGASVDFDGRSVNAKLLENASVTDARFAGGAKGDGVTDDTAAFEAAAAAARNIYVPPGRYAVRDVNVPSGRRFYGAGKSAWEPYTGGDKPAIYLTELVVDGSDAFNCRNTNSVTIEGMGICSKLGKQSVYRAAPGYQAKTGGIAITGSSQFQARDVSFFGLEYGVHSHLTSATIPGSGTVSGVETDEANASANPTQMPKIDDWQASDCRFVFGFGNDASTGYTVRDVKISNEVVALHCEGIARIHWADGVRFENLRLYQCTGNSIFMRKCVFVSFAAVCAFETGQDAIVLQECENIDASGGLMVGRTGFYAAPTGSPATYAQRKAIVLDRCITAAISGVIEKPTGRSIDIVGCTTTSVSIALDTPFWLTGNASAATGAINVTNSVGTNINAAVGGENHWSSVAADESSARTLTGSVTSYRSVGMTRAAHLQQKGGYVFRLAAEMQIGPGGALPFNGLQDVVPAGKRLVTRCVEITSSAAQLRVVDNNDSGNAIIWNMTSQTFGSFSLETRNLYNNTGTTDVLASVQLTLRNPTGAVITLPIGTEIRISTAIV